MGNYVRDAMYSLLEHVTGAARCPRVCVMFVGGGREKGGGDMFDWQESHQAPNTTIGCLPVAAQQKFRALPANGKLDFIAQALMPNASMRGIIAVAMHAPAEDRPIEWKTVRMSAC